jgi:hypothetical protein
MPAQPAALIADEEGDVVAQAGPPASSPLPPAAAEALAGAEALRARGNDLFRAADFVAALAAYQEVRGSLSVRVSSARNAPRPARRWTACCTLSWLAASRRTRLPPRCAATPRRRACGLAARETRRSTATSHWRWSS